MPEAQVQTGTNPRTGAPIYSTVTYKKRNTSAKGRRPGRPSTGDPNLGRTGSLQGMAKAKAVFPGLAEGLKIKKNK